MNPLYVHRYILCLYLTIFLFSLAFPAFPAYPYGPVPGIYMRGRGGGGGGRGGRGDYFPGGWAEGQSWGGAGHGGRGGGQVNQNNLDDGRTEVRIYKRTKKYTRNVINQMLSPTLSTIKKKVGKTPLTKY